MKHLMKLVGIILLLSACNNTVYFDKPQPEGVKDLAQIPFWYRGQYQDKDSNSMIIDNKRVIVKSFYNMKYTKKENDRTKKFYVDALYLTDRETNEKYSYTMLHDTMLVRQYEIDTIFHVSNTNIVRQFKGNLILNYKRDNSWRVEILSLKWPFLKHRMFNSKEMFDKLATISDSEVFTDSTKKVVLGKVLKPTKKQFEKILTQKDSLLINEYRKVR